MSTQAERDLASFLLDVAATIAPMMVEAGVNYITLGEHGGRCFPYMQGRGRIVGAEEQRHDNGSVHTSANVDGVPLMRWRQEDED